MNHSFLKTRISSAFAVLASGSLLALSAPPALSPEPRPLGTNLDALVEAEWLAHNQATSPPHIRTELERAWRLAHRLRPAVEPSGLHSLEDELRQIGDALTVLEAAGPVPGPTAEDLYLKTRRCARKIAFTNPLLRQLDRILFITRHDAGGVFHMVDQFYGFNAPAGGQLLVLINPLGPNPRLVDLLEHATVQNGRLAGQKLEGGAFLAPELSFDGQTILFAWTQAQGQDLEWSPRASYHLFKVKADGRDLVQLTDGAWNDFDPCFLPGGRIAFISERRGGFLRCGRYCPTYTLFSMEPDGQDIICLSFHETHEWHPSITHQGLIIYTRWDYVDRDTNIAHHPWTCRPDGGDPRAIHGNYPIRRESRPWMEMDIRAIPDSHKFVATAAAHHGHAFGSLVLINPQVPDDGADSQITRLTPEVPFPEAEQNRRPIAQCMVYGTPWPLSEDDYLCVYDPAAKNRGIYWIDRFGNKELLYRDPSISALSPIPLRPRPKPPVLPDQTLQTARALRESPQPDRPATIALMNVYDSDFTWPTNTIITALRVIQVLPKTTPAPNDPRIGVAQQSNARAVLGTVPVEKDGSAYFQAPPGIELYFQALDRTGAAVQSMRSGTYLHRGEQLLCQGCHEPRLRAARPAATIPLALQRPPSSIQPEPDGSNPFSFVRLVQPVLDRHCVDCHKQQAALDLTGTGADINGWTRSYQNLAAQYGFYFHVSNGAIHTGAHGGSRTIPGQFGARLSPLLPFLDERHYNVQLPEADRRRITLWLDCNSEFYGSYENTAAQANGQVVHPSLH